MNKKGVLWILLDSVFFIVFNVIFFAIIGTDHGAAGWISYVLIMLAYILLIVTPYLVRNSKSKAVFGFSLYVIGSVYFLVELIVGIVFILVTSTSFKVVLLVQEWQHLYQVSGKPHRYFEFLVVEISLCP